MVNELQRELEKTRRDLAARCSAEREGGQGEWGPPDLLRLEELHQDLSRLRQENKGTAKLTVNLTAV